MTAKNTLQRTIPTFKKLLKKRYIHLQRAYVRLYGIQNPIHKNISLIKGGENYGIVPFNGDDLV